MSILNMLTLFQIHLSFKLLYYLKPTLLKKRKFYMLFHSIPFNIDVLPSPKRIEATKNSVT